MQDKQFSDATVASWSIDELEEQLGSLNGEGPALRQRWIELQQSKHLTDEEVGDLPLTETDQNLLMALGLAGAAKQLEPRAEEAGPLVDRELAERHLALLGFEATDPVILCAYGDTNRYTPARKGKQYDWKVVTKQAAKGERDWEKVEADLQKKGTPNLGYISCPGGARSKARSGRPAEIFQVHLLTYEIDQGLSKAEQLNTWKLAGLPEPTCALDTGNKSIHITYRLATPLDVPQGQAARARLSAAIEAAISGVKTDAAMHSAHQPARLAGGIHPKTGKRSTLVMEGGHIYETEEFLALLPEVPEKTTGQGYGNLWADNRGEPEEGEVFPALPLSVPVPLTIAISETTQKLIKEGKRPSTGGRPPKAHSISCTLQCAEKQLEELGQPFTGSALELFDQFVVASDLYGGDTDWAYQRHWETEDIGCGEMSKLALRRALRGFARTELGWDFTQPVEEEEDDTASEVSAGVSEDIAKVAATRHASRKKKPLDHRIDVYERYVRALVRKIRNSLRRTAKLREAQKKLNLSTALKAPDLTRMVMEAHDDRAGNSFKPLTAAERAAMATPKVEWLLKDLVPSGDVTIIGGRPKVGKTRFSVAVMRSILNGEALMGFEAAGPGRTVIFASDDQSDGDTASMLQVAGIWTHPLLIWSRRFRMTEKNLDALLKTIEQNPGAVVVIDSLRSVTRSTGIDENSSEIGPLVYDLKQAVTDAGGTLLLIHHCNKSNDAIGVEALSGHNSIPSAANTVLTLHYLDETKKDSDERRLVREARSGVGCDLVTRSGADARYSSLGNFSEHKAKSQSQEHADSLASAFIGDANLAAVVRTMLRIFRNGTAGAPLLGLMQENDLLPRDVQKVSQLKGEDQALYRKLRDWLDKEVDRKGKRQKAGPQIFTRAQIKVKGEGRTPASYGLTKEGADAIERIFDLEDE